MSTMLTAQSSITSRRYKIVLAGHHGVGKEDIFLYLQGGGGGEQHPAAGRSLRNREKWLAKIQVTGPRGTEEAVDVSMGGLDCFIYAIYEAITTRIELMFLSIYSTDVILCEISLPSIIC